MSPEARAIKNSKQRAYYSRNRVFIRAKSKIELQDPERRAHRNKTQNQYYHRNREAVRARAAIDRQKTNKGRALKARENFASALGLSVEEIKLAIAQTHCDICGVEGVKMNIDHCHQTQTFRGVLCHRCNMSLGGFRDDEHIMSKAIAYLVSHKKRIA